MPICKSNDAADSSSDVLGERRDEVATATGPKFNAGGICNVWIGSKWVEDGGEGSWEALLGRVGERRRGSV